MTILLLLTVTLSPLQQQLYRVDFTDQVHTSSWLSDRWPNTTREWACTPPACACWIGTTATFALLPWHNNPKVKPWITAAACTALAGLFGIYIGYALTQ